MILVYQQEIFLWNVDDKKDINLIIELRINMIIKFINLPFPISFVSSNDLIIFFHISSISANKVILPITKRPQRARDKATHIRLCVLRKPIFFSKLLRTNDKIIISFSSP